MSRERADRLFARFRRRGDPAALAALFDATAPELGRVALWLTGDAHAAEDLVQSAFLVAIEGAQRFDERQRVVPWLLGIVANRARHLRRQRARRLDPQRARLAPLPDPADEAARRELAAALERAVQDMSSPYKEVLALHLQHGLSAKEIGAALGRPAGTVRTQIVRALDLLRAALPAGFAAAAVTALARLRGLAAVRETVLAHAAAKLGLAAGGAGAVAVTVGVLAMHKVTVVSVVAAVAIAAWLLPWRAPGSPPRAMLVVMSLPMAQAAALHENCPLRWRSGAVVLPDHVVAAAVPEPFDNGAARITVVGSSTARRPAAWPCAASASSRATMAAFAARASARHAGPARARVARHGESRRTLERPLCAARNADSRVTAERTLLAPWAVHRWPARGPTACAREGGTRHAALHERAVQSHAVSNARSRRRRCAAHSAADHRAACAGAPPL